MVQCQTRKTKKSSEVLFDDDLSPGINVTRDNVKITKTAITVVAGWMLFACMLTILIWGLPNFECGLSFSPFTISIKKLKYIDPHSEGDLLKAKEYQNWVRNWQYGNNISFRKDCGEECLDGNASKEENPQLPLEEPKKVEGSFCVDIPLEMKFDCHPDGSPSESSCVKRGCCWHELQEIPERKVPFPAPRLHRPTHGKALEDLPLNIPYCFYPRDYVGYSVTNFTSAEHGYTGFLERSVASVFPKDSPLLQMDVYFETDTRLRVRITDPFQLRWETPVPIVPQVNKSASNPSYSFHIRNEDGAFTVVRKSSGVPIFDTRGAAPLTFADQFIQLSSMLPSNYIYGLGEHLEGLLLDTYWKRHVLWNLDQIPEPGKNMYGSHPFYLSLEPDGNTHGVFLLNSNAMDVVLQPTPALTFRVIGGLIDLYIFLGPTPNEVISQYTEVIGRPFLPPYWSLGYHQCRYGYETLNRTRDVWQRTRKAGIPFDVQWNDIDYMKHNNDFTYDQTNYDGLPDFVEDLHREGMHYVPIIDPGISAAEPQHTYPPWDEGVHLRVFVRNSSNMPFVGKVWNPVATSWPDFTHPKATYYWSRQILRYHSSVPIDGAWIDMNEPSNFLSGSTNGCEENNLEHPPFLPAVHGGILYYHTICMSGRHFVGRHYNVHNLYGITETISTNMALQIVRGKRPFVISRSTFPGQGHYGGHWTGDVWSDWFNLWQSVAGILNFNMYGIPMVGADICGFNGNTTASLCLRWMQLGAFYPFSRNHNTDDAIDQDPVAMGPEVVTASRNALTQRYMLLPYLYSLFFNAHLTGEPVARPLFFQFYKELETYSIDTQFMWGPALMIVPVLKEHDETVKAYIPNGRWYDWYKGNVVEGEGTYVTLDAPLDKIPLLVRGGYILPIQMPANTTTESRKMKRGLLVAPNEKGRASGEFYWDDGDSLGTVKHQEYTYIQFISGPGILNVNVNRTTAGYTEPISLGYMYILGLSDSVSEVTVDGSKASFEYDPENQFLTVDGFSQSLLKSFNVRWK